MNDQFKKLTEEIKGAMLSQKEASAIVEQTKAAADSGTFEFVISTADIDRQGDIVDQNGWDLSHYKNNPIVLWAHDYMLPPIGITDDISLVSGKLVAKGRFAPTAFAQEIRALYEAKILRTASVGFIPKEYNGKVISKAELLEWSIVPVPANPMALSLAKELNLDAEVLMQKGLFIKSEETAEDKKEGEVVEPNKETIAETGQAASTEEKKPEEKGAVADMIDARESLTWELIDKKYELLGGVYDIIGAFSSVFLDDRMPLDQFEPLLNETIALLTEYAKNPQEVSDGSVVGKATKAKSGDLLAILAKQKQGRAEKAGRVLSEKNRTTITTAIEGMKAGIAALDELLSATDEKGSEGKSKSGDGDSPNQRSKGAGSELLKDMDMFFDVKRVLRSVNTVTSEALARINTKAKK